MRRWIAWLPPLAALAVYAAAPWGELVWDDQLIARQQIAALRGFADAFFPPADISQWTYTYYRPVVLLSYLADQALFGRGAAMGPHVVNMLLHALATVATFFLARRLLAGLPRGGHGALFAALVFAVHPIHTESVSWIAARTDVLATLFLVPTLLALLRWRDTGSIGALVAAPVLFLLALLSKEVAITGLALAPLVLWLAPRPHQDQGQHQGQVKGEAAGGRGPWPTAFGAAAMLLAATIVWFTLRSAAQTEAAGLSADSLAAGLVRLLRAGGWYLAKLAWPWPQSHFVPWEAVPGAARAALVAAVFAAATALAFAFRRRPAGAVALVALGWIAATLAPSVAVAFGEFAATPVAERYLYLPSVGLVLLLGAGLDRLLGATRAAVAAGVAIALVVGLGAATVVRSQVWLSDLRLWGDAIGRAGNDPVALIEFGKAQFQAGALDEAETAFARALAIATRARLEATSAYNLGVIAAMRSNYPSAEQYFTQATITDPTYGMGHYGLGRIVLERAQRSPGAEVPALVARARQLQETAVRLAPAHAPSWLELGRVMAAEGELAWAAGEPGAAQGAFRSALDAIDRAADLDPAVLDRPGARELKARLATLIGGGG